jgi:hypothetical protein
MPFEAGNQFGKRNLGVKKTKNQQWEKFAMWFMGKGMERLETEMAALEGKDYVVTVKDMLEYFKPKLARSEQDVNLSGEITTNVTNYAGSTDIPSPPISTQSS